MERKARKKAKKKAKVAVTKYGREDPRCKVITSKKLAMYIGCTNTPNSIVENTHSNNLLEALDPAYPIPCRGVWLQNSITY